MRIKTIAPALLAGFVALGAAALAAPAPAAAQAMNDRLEVFGPGQRGWFEERDRFARGQFDRGYRQGRFDERRFRADRERLEVFGPGRRGWFEERDRLAREQFDRGYRLGREEERRFGAGRAQARREPWGALGNVVRGPNDLNLSAERRVRDLNIDPGAGGN